MKTQKVYLESDAKKISYFVTLFGSTLMLLSIMFWDIFKGINAEFSLKIFIYSIIAIAFLFTLFLVLKYFSKACYVFDDKFVVSNLQKKFGFEFADINEIVLMPHRNSLSKKENYEWYYFISKTQDLFLKYGNIKKIITNNDFFIISINKANKLRSFFKQYSKGIVCPEKYKYLLKDGLDYFVDINNFKS